MKNLVTMTLAILLSLCTGALAQSQPELEASPSTNAVACSAIHAVPAPLLDEYAAMLKDPAKTITFLKKSDPLLSDPDHASNQYRVTGDGRDFFVAVDAHSEPSELNGIQFLAEMTVLGQDDSYDHGVRTATDYVVRDEINGNHDFVNVRYSTEGATKPYVLTEHVNIISDNAIVFGEAFFNFDKDGHLTEFAPGLDDPFFASSHCR